MSHYAKANTTIQRFDDDFPGSRLTLDAERMVLVLHCTEGTSWPDYEGGKTAPNYTGHPPLKGISKGAWRMHFPDEMSSRALRNLSGGVETNTLNALQVEVIGTCDPKHAVSWNGEGKLKAGRDYVYWPDADDGQLRWLADLIADQHKRHGLRLTAPKFQAYPASYGARSGTNNVRLSFEEWRDFTGVCGHQHVPENAHGDPGNIDMPKVLAMARAIVKPTKPKPKPTPAGQLRFKVGTLNVRSLPRHDDTVETTMRKGGRGVALMGWQEVDNPVYRARLAELKQYEHFYGGELDVHHNAPLSWDADVWDRATASSAGAEKIIDGRSGICHTRYATWVELRHASTGQRIILTNRHQVPGAFGPLGRPRAAGDRVKLRQEMWDDANARDLQLLEDLIERGHPIACMGDQNRQKVSAYPTTIGGRRVQAVAHGLDWLHFIDGDDYAWTLVGGKQTRQVDDTDHRALIQDVILKRRAS